VAYILYTYTNGGGMPFDTIWDPAVTSYTLSNTIPKYKSESYVIAAMRLPRCTSILSNEINTIHEEVSVDTCNKKIDITWNSYPSFPVVVHDYSVLLSVNGGNFTEAAKVSSSDNSFTLNSFTTNDEYYFIVRANLEDDTFSTSNKDSVSTEMQDPPEWINADFATVNEDNKIALTFTVDPSSEITKFGIERKTGSSGSFSEIARMESADGSVKYTDGQADAKVVNYYRLSAINNCNIPVTVSNLASNIVLSLERSGNELNLSWNNYKDWLGTISSYRLYINTGSSFEERKIILPPDSTISLNYQELMYEVTGDKVCFYIAATETSNPYGIKGESRSYEVCTIPTEIITVPNLFTPDNDLQNDLFRPRLSFTPVDYHLIISNRQGNTLFESKDFLEDWDGTQNGNPQPQGVYLWFVKATAPSGKVMSKTGTITIYRK
jgi:gliding motility-associated-like protein